MPLRTPKAFLIFITTPTKKEASKLASQLIRNRLVACVNLVNSVESIFWWKGRVTKSKEVLLIAKSNESKFDLMKKFIARHHSYEVPEIIGFPIQKGSSSYLKWISDSLNRA